MKNIWCHSSLRCAFVTSASSQLALTAASPLWRGYIADVDCRWNVIAGSVDDRTEEERGLKVNININILRRAQRRRIQPLNENRLVIPKSRYDSVDLYISEDWINRPEYNDTNVPYDQAIYDRLREHGTNNFS